MTPWTRALASLPAPVRHRAERHAARYLGVVPIMPPATPARVQAALSTIPRWFTATDVQAALQPLGLALTTGKPRWHARGSDLDPFNDVSIVDASGRVVASARGRDTADAFRTLQRDVAGAWRATGPV